MTGAAASPNIAFRSHSRVTEIVPAQGGAGVDGIRFGAGSGKLETLGADLVVDASGRGTLALAPVDALDWQHSCDPFVGASLSLITPHVIAASPFPDSASQSSTS
jgi:hypothetical protein